VCVCVCVCVCIYVCKTRECTTLGAMMPPLCVCVCVCVCVLCVCVYVCANVCSMVYLNVCFCVCVGRGGACSISRWRWRIAPQTEGVRGGGGASGPVTGVISLNADALSKTVAITSALRLV